jgi:hypothetical protein
MDNPVVKVLRGSGLNATAFQKRWGFSKDGFQQALNGTYVDLSERLIAALESTCVTQGLDLDKMLSSEYGTTDMNEAYHLWQSNSRVAWAHNLYEPKGKFRSNGKFGSPAHFFFVDSAGSRDRFAKGMKLSRATLMRWERGYTKGMPVTVESALNEVGYDWISDLMDAQRDWIEEVF